MGSYIELLPNTEAHRAFIEKSIVNNDIDTLKRIKDNLHLPIHVIRNYAEYLTDDHPQGVVVQNEFNRTYYELLDGRIFDWQGNETKIPLSTPMFCKTVLCETIEYMQRCVSGNVPYNNEKK